MLTLEKVSREVLTLEKAFKSFRSCLKGESKTSERQGASKTLLKMKSGVPWPFQLIMLYYLSMGGLLLLCYQFYGWTFTVIVSVLWVDFGSDLMLALACQEPNGNVCMPNWFKFALTNFHHNLTLSWEALKTLKSNQFWIGIWNARNCIKPFQLKKVFMPAVISSS